MGFLLLDNVEKESKLILLDYVRERSELFNLKEKFVVTRYKIIHVITTLNNHKLKDNYRFRFLQEAWQFVLESICEGLGKEKKNKKKLEKLKLLPDSKRDEMLKSYYTRAKLRFRMKVFEQMQIAKGFVNISKDPIYITMKNEQKALEKKLGFKKETNSTSTLAIGGGGKDHLASKGASTANKVGKGSVANGKATITSQTAAAALVKQSPLVVTTELAQAVHERSKHHTFQFYPSHSIMKTMIEKAISSYEKSLTKRRETVNNEAKKHASILPTAAAVAAVPTDPSTK